MTRTRNRFFAALISAVMIITLIPVFGTGKAAYADDERSLDHFTLKGDASSWGHKYIVDDNDGTLMLDDLHIAVIDDLGDVVSAENYDITIQRTWYDEEQEKEVFEDVTEPYGLADSDKYTDENQEGCGFTEFVVTAEPKEDSGFAGNIEAHFFIAHKYSLNYICSSIEFMNHTSIEGWRMRDIITIMRSRLDDPVVYGPDGSELTAGTDYKVEYYYSEIFYDEHGIAFDKGEKTGNDGADLPTENGVYFVDVTGLSPYYGSGEVLIDVRDIIFSAQENEPADLWSDSDKTYDVELPDVDGELWIGVGVRNNEDEWEELFTGEDNESDHFIYDDENKTLTLKGEAIYDSIGDRDLNLYACIHDETYYEGEGWNIVAEGFENVQVRQSRYDLYDLPDSEAILTGDSMCIRSTTGMYVENAEYPDGKEFNDLAVKSVSIESQTPDEEGGTVLVEPVFIEENDEWRIRSENTGTAEVKVTYADFNGDEQDHMIDVTVSDNVYNTDCWSENGKYQGFPEESIVLNGYAERKYLDDKGDEQHTTEGLHIHWEICEGADFATIAEDDNKATVTFKVMPEGWDSIGERVVVRAWTTDDNAEDPNAQCGDAMYQELHVESDYYDIEPAVLTPEQADIDIGDSFELEPAVYHYVYGSDREKVTDSSLKFRIDNYSEDDLEVREPDWDNGETAYTITRLSDGSPGFSVRAEWKGNDCERWYNLDWKDYNVWFDSDTDELYSDGDLRITLNSEIDLDKRDGDNNPVYEVKYTVGTGSYNDDDDVDWDSIFDETSYEGDGTGITLKGDKIYEELVNEQGEIENNDVIVKVEIKKGDNLLSRTDTKVFLSEPEEQRINDQELLSGWSYYISSEENVFVRNSEYPDGEDFTYTVTGVAVKSQSPDEGTEEGADVVTVAEEEGEWICCAENCGEATIEVSYKDPEELGGEEGSFEFRIWVKSEIFSVNINNESGMWRTVPGDTITLAADVNRESVDEEAEMPDLTYDWGFVYGDDLATLEEVDGHPEKITVKFNDKPEDYDDYYSGNVLVWVKLISDDSEVAYSEEDLYVEESFEELISDDLGEMKPGESRTVNAEVRSYPSDTEGEDYDVLDDVSFGWDYDQSVLSIKDEEGSEIGTTKLTGRSVKYTITRLTCGETDLTLSASWRDENDDLTETGRSYWLDQYNYTISFVEDDYVVYDDFKTVLELDKSDLEMLDEDEYEIGYEVGYYNESDEFVTVDENSGIYSIENGFVTIYGDKVKAAELGGVNVHAVLKVNGEEHDNAWTWVDLREACAEHSWVTEVTKAATCTETGLQTQVCKECGEVRADVEIPALGHNKKAVAAKAPTCTEAGNSAYWYCDRCNKYFSDEACLVEVENESWVLPATGHTEEKVPGVAPTCEKTGLTEGTKCSVCGETIKAQEEIPALGHDYQVVEGSAKAATCTEAGKEADKKCSRCGDVVTGATIPATGHSEEKVPGVEPTCEKTGLTEGAKCSICGETIKEQEEIPALGHDWGEWTEAEPSTCIKKGQMVRVCKRDPEHKEYKDIDLLAHTLVKIEAKEATCTEDGNIEYWTCSVCKKIFSDAEGKTEITQDDTVIKATGHTFEHVDLQRATNKKAGHIEYWECTECGMLFKDVEGNEEIAKADTVIKKDNISIKLKKKELTGKAKKNTSYAAKKVFKVSNNKGRVTYKKKGGNSNITVSKTGKVTIKKGLIKKKTYTIKVEITSAKTAKYAKYTKTLMIKIKIK